MMGERCVRTNDVQMNKQQYAGASNSATEKYMSKMHKNIRNMEWKYTDSQDSTSFTQHAGLQDPSSVPDAGVQSRPLFFYNWSRIY